MEEDKKLVEEFKNGNEEAFNRIVLKYKDRLYSIAYRLLSNAEEAKDMIQETFINAYKSMKKFEGDKLFSWLATITMNLSKNKLREWSRHGYWQTVSLNKDINSEDGSTIKREIADPSVSSLEMLEAKEREQIVQKALDKLEPQYKTVVILVDFDGLDYEAVAQICKCPVGTVRSRLHRGRTMLKDLLKECLNEAPRN